MSSPVFTVLDLETTGMGPSARIIELAMVRIENGQVTNRLSSLINPELHIPDFITRLTGISNTMIREAPVLSEVAGRFLEFMAGTIPVAHNAHFDHSILNQELIRLGLNPVTDSFLCTVRLSRRLNKGLKSHSLSSLKAHFGIRHSSAHRAHGDAEATALLLLHFLEKLEMGNAPVTGADLLSFQYSPVGVKPVSEKKLTDLKSRVTRFPERPGIYQFIGKNEQVLYVGKAIRLKERVLTYFNGFHVKETKWVRLIRQTTDIRYLETGDELHALVIESRLIKRFLPPYNTLQRRLRHYPFIRLSARHPFPSFSLTREIREDGCDYFGPFSGGAVTGILNDLIEQSGLVRLCDDVTFSRGKLCTWYSMGKCPGPCTGEMSGETYREGIRLISDLLSGRGRGLIGHLEGKMNLLAEREEFEQAARLRNKLREIEKQTFKHVSAGGTLNRNTYVMFHVRDGETGYYLIRFGLLVTHGVLKSEQDLADLTAACREFYSGLAKDMELPPLGAEAVDEIRLILNWTYKNRKNLKFLFPSESETEHSWHDVILSTCGTLLTHRVNSQKNRKKPEK